MQRPFLAVVAGLALVALAGRAVAQAGDPPYLKLARDLGTPDLADSSGPKDRSQLLLHFVRRGESYATWTKMTTVSIARVRASDTDAATGVIIDRLRARLVQKHVALDSFRRHSNAPVSGSFAFHTRVERDVGIVYSPTAGFVTVAQLGARGAGRIEKEDVARLRAIVAK